MTDLIVRGGLVVDGSGAEPFHGDVVVADGRIAVVGHATAAVGAEVVDAVGSVVAPGFIDTHTHSDALPFLDESHDSLRLAGVRQGVTTEIAGNCGFSLFPAPGPAPDVARHIGALFGDGSLGASDIAVYRNRVEDRRLAANLATLVGQGTLRASVVGFEDRPATQDELARMEAAADAALAAGAAGLSTGLLYPPGSYASTDEVTALAGIAAGYGRSYATHMRNEMNGVAEALEEAISIGRLSGAAVHISHLKAAGPRNHGRLPDLLARIDAARRDGVDVTADIYPYTAGSTMLHALLPPWATTGGVAALLDRLDRKEVRDRLRADFASPPAGWQNFLDGAGWDAVTIASSPRRPSVEGRTVAQIAAETGADGVGAACNLLIAEEGSVTVVVEMADERDMEACLAWPHSTIGSDGIPIPGKPHPRWAGSFARVLGRMVRDRGVLTLPEAVRKMSHAAAARFGLRGRGLIRPGASADLVVFDPDSVTDGATYRNPLLRPTGVPHVLVNGVPVIRDGEDTGLRPGRFLAAGRGPSVRQKEQ